MFAVTAKDVARWCSVIVIVTCLTSCSGGTTSSGTTSFAGRYVGTIVVAGVSKPVAFTVTSDGFVEPELPAGGGVVCAGDMPQSIGLDNDRFDLTTNGQCFIGGLPCPLNLIITGSIQDETMNGSGSILLGCGNFSGPFNFTFVARRE